MDNFLFLTHDIHNPFFNLASEEYLLKQKEQSFIYVWKNEPSVIIGVNQNTFEEVNLPFAERNNIKIVRRLTGGGAVFHDLYNINYTIICEKESEKQSFKFFSLPVINYLKSLGISAEFSGRNDILVDGKKVSGTAQTVYKNRVMHHGTLLFKSNINTLSNVLKPNIFKTQSKGIKSVKSRVGNISDYTSLSENDFFLGLKKFLKKDYKEYSLSPFDMENIESLVKTKYSTDEWNFNRSPKAQNTFSAKFPFGVFNFCFDTVDGKISNPSIFGDFFNIKPLDDFVLSLSNIDFNRQSLISAFSVIDQYIVGAIGQEIVEKMLGI